MSLAVAAHTLPERVEGARLWLAKHDPALAEVMFTYVDQDRDRLRRFLPWVDFVRGVADEARFIADTHAQWERGEVFDYGLFRRSDGRYLGNLGVHHVAWGHHRCELGYWILGDFEGQGYISEAVMLIEGVLFARGFHRVEIRCSDLNARSAAVPERLGYRLEGTLRQSLLEHGAFRDVRVYAKLASELGP